MHYKTKQNKAETNTHGRIVFVLPFSLSTAALHNLGETKKALGEFLLSPVGILPRHKAT